MNHVTITPSDNGPYLIQGGFTLLDAEGNRYEVADTIALCRCGHSSTKPFCDGTHEKTNFAEVSRAATGLIAQGLQASPADEAAGEGEEGFVNVVAAVGADQESAGGCGAWRRCVRRPSGGRRALSRAQSGGER